MIQYFSSLLVALIIMSGQVAHAQVLGNEWINYSQSYFKIKIGKNGIYRIPQALLQSNGMGGVAGTQFALYREGQQVPIYVSTNGTLTGTDYIEFYGSRADGKMDTELYVPATRQMNTEINIISDTSVYFLTYSAVGVANARLQLHANVMPAIPPVAEPFCVTTVYPNEDPRATQSPGETYSSIINFHTAKFDKAEGPSYASVSNLDLIFPTVAVYTTAAAPTLTTSLYFFNRLNNRALRLRVNKTESSITAAAGLLLDTVVNAYALITKSIPFNQALLGANGTRFRVQGGASWYVLKAGLQYNRTFNFSGVSALDFSVAGNNQEQLLTLTNLNTTAANIIVDRSSNNIYHLSAGNNVLLQPLSGRRDLFFADNPSEISTVEQITFTDYTQAMNQGSYLILTDDEFIGIPNGGVAQYKNYRSSADGGDFNTVVISANQLYDQFGWGYDYHPLGIKRFLRYAAASISWQAKPEYMFIIGKGITYHKISHYINNRATLNFPIVPTFGDPGSDNLFAEIGNSSIPSIPIGRLSAKTDQDIQVYLSKVMAYETAQKVPAYPNLENSLWKKSALHVAGSTDAANQPTFNNALNVCKSILEDTMIGGTVHTTSLATASVLDNTSARMDSLTQAGLQYITYYGHASSSGFDYNLNNPERINSHPRYPIFLAFGCDVARIFEPSNSISISERYLAEPQGGAVAMVASTNLGWTGYLDYYMQGLYIKMARDDYGKTFGKQYLSNLSRMATFNTTAFTDAHLQNFLLQGDPGLRVFSPDKPDYFIDSTLVSATPTDLNTSVDSFKINTKIYNLGRSTRRLVPVVLTKMKNGDSTVLYSDTVRVSVLNSRNVTFTVPVDKINDVGLLHYVITVNPQRVPDELSFSNNKGAIDLYIGASALVPTYPYEFSIVNQQNIELKATTLSPFGAPMNFIMEVDTTEYFNSPLKVTQNATGSGGVIKWTMPITMTDSTVYYWRTAVDTTVSGRKYWSTSSFIYLPAAGQGWNQSHFFQFQKDKFGLIQVEEPDRIFKGVRYFQPLSIQARVFGYGGESSIYLNNAHKGFGSCVSPNLNAQGILLMVIDNVTGKFLKNTNQFAGAVTACGGVDRENQFEFLIADSVSRRRVAEFLDAVPAGHYVVVRSSSYNTTANTTSAADWISDEANMGIGNTLLHKFQDLGFSNITDLVGNLPFAGVAQKGNTSFGAVLSIGNTVEDLINLQVDLPFVISSGTLTSSVIGPATQWQQLQWRSTNDLDAFPGNDRSVVSVWGLTHPDQVGDSLFSTTNVDTSLSTISAAQYPYLRIKWFARDSVTMTLPQLAYWRVLHQQVPEAALNPRLASQYEDTVNVGALMNFRFAMENLSSVPMDSMKVRFRILNLESNSTTVFDPPKFRPMSGNDTVMVGLYGINSTSFIGRNVLYVEANPADDRQPEQYHPNNSGFFPFVVDDGALPVKIMSFDVHKQGEAALLEWITASERNSHGFGVEKSGDGKAWTKIGYVDSRSTGGNSSAMLSYKFVDEKPFAGLNYYRLKQTDLDGKYEYSIVRTLRFDNSDNIEVYPNPANTYIEISGLTGDEDIVIFDVGGRKVNEFKAQRANTVTLSLANLGEGTYMVNIIDPNGQISASKKVVKIK